MTVNGRAYQIHLPVDAPTTELSATDAMWEFFKGHPKP
jgi:poly(3-hydroxybutyrate) depolymerase